MSPGAFLGYVVHVALLIMVTWWAYRLYLRDCARLNPMTLGVRYASPTDDPALRVRRTRRLAEANAHTLQQQEDYRQCLDAVMQEWTRTPEKTRFSLLPMFGGVFMKLCTGVVGEFTRLNTLKPELVSQQGKILILDYPIQQYGAAGRMLQLLFKQIFDLHMLRRDGRNAIPVCRWIDEAPQLLIPGHDAMVQCVARQSGYICVTIIQDLQSARAKMGGGEAGVQELDGLIANHALKILHRNSCAVTNNYWSDLCGRRKEYLYGGSVQQTGFDFAADLLGLRPSQATASFNETYEPDLKPNVFLTLAAGGPANHWCSEAIVIHGNQPAHSGRIWERVIIPQEIV